MAIRKDEIPVELDSFQRRKLNHIERDIDRELEERYLGEPLTVDIDGWRLHRKVWEALKDRYERAGWKVVFGVGENFIEFS